MNQSIAAVAISNIYSLTNTIATATNENNVIVWKICYWLSLNYFSLDFLNDLMASSLIPYHIHSNYTRVKVNKMSPLFKKGGWKCEKTCKYKGNLHKQFWKKKTVTST